MGRGLRRLLGLICFLAPIVVFGQIEICDNGIDDDQDGLIDLNDDDCACTVIEPVSVIPNPSFEDMNCCPTERSQLECADLWIQASEPTTDYIHNCGWGGRDEFLPPQPFPDGDGIMGFRDGRVRNNTTAETNWKEYAGACLISPLLAGSTYRFEFDVGFSDSQRSPPLDITFFGTSSCDNLPFGVGDEAFGCPTNGPDWLQLGEVSVSGGTGNVWVNTFIEITPDVDIAAIAIGPGCSAGSTTISTYYFFDNLLLADIESFDFEISENLHPCNDNFTLSVPSNDAFEYQWYKSGMALSGEVFPELTQNYGEGIYQVRVLDGASCRVSMEYEYVLPQVNTFPAVAICEGEYYDFGDLRITEPGSYLDTFKNVNNCDSIVALELEVIGLGYDTVEASVLTGQAFVIDDNDFFLQGEYEVRLVSSIGCDSLVLLRLNNFNVYIPTAFSPNADGVNDTFFPFVPAEEVESIDMQVFDRWGGLVFQGERWDGRDQQAGVYVYTINIDFVGGYSRLFNGALTLVK